MTSFRINRNLHRKTRYGLAALLLAVSLFTVTSIGAQGEHARRVSAELTVLAGDLRKLSASITPEHHAEGLRQRIEGGLVTLDILTRLADMELGNSIKSRFSQIAAMRDDFASNRLLNVELGLTALVKEYPLQLPDIVVGDISEFAEIHQTHCAACHDHPDLSVERPAYNLSNQIIDTPELEMFARILVGVRGDRMTGIDNPLTDRQLMGLMEFYRSQ